MLQPLPTALGSLRQRFLRLAAELAQGREQGWEPAPAALPSGGGVRTGGGAAVAGVFLAGVQVREGA